ncbi:MAG: ribonuclease activity regulator RraA [Chloroflexota bacterium]|nr:ribonuclease activity regulator RraA [Chloroflexota bacterium]
MLIEGLEPLPSGTLETLRRASAASVTTELSKLGIRHSQMLGPAPLDRSYVMVGEAVTLRYVPAREDLDSTEAMRDPNHPQRYTIERMGPGEVLVIDARGDVRAGTLGEILVAKMKAAGAAGFVTDGAIRDVAGIEATGLPAFVKAAHASASTTIHHAADYNHVIGCGGIMVRPGDVIFGDADGVVVIPRHLAAEVAEKAAAREELEVFIKQKIDGGESLRGNYPPGEETLREYEAWRKRS